MKDIPRRMIEKTNLLFGIILIVAAAFNQATALEQGSTFFTFFFIFENFLQRNLFILKQILENRFHNINVVNQ